MSASPGRGPLVPSAIDRVVGRIAQACGVLAAVAIVVILVLVCVEMLLRQFKMSLLVTDEIAGYLNAAAIFLGLAWTLREGGFIRVEILYDRVSGALKQALNWLIVLTAVAFTGATLWFCTAQVIYVFNSDPRAVSVIETPEWIPQSTMVLGLAVLLLQLLAWVVDRVRRIP